MAFGQMSQSNAHSIMYNNNNNETAHDKWDKSGKDKRRQPNGTQQSHSSSSSSDNEEDSDDDQYNIRVTITNYELFIIVSESFILGHC